VNISKLALLISALTLLGGCVAVPVASDYYTDSAGYYGPAPAYVAPAPLYVAPPTVYFGPRIVVRPHIGGGDHRGTRDPGRRPGRDSDRDRDRGSHRSHGRH
jgi:hypothetical protein